ncbi:unnamed protein product [Dovyalis caffra]|uniref:Uncharacterized protein n=1 Tax=Dovyalis caffra TaxID=77055 RepID=A0AAV1S2Y9_9ROSI|nr:unnamed protein product [Dovyalis caffra]
MNSSCSVTEYAEMVGRLREDFSQKLKVIEFHEDERSPQNNYYPNDQLLNDESPRLQPVVQDQEEKEEEEEEFSFVRTNLQPVLQDQEEKEEEEEFSFVCINPSGPLISAEDIFQNGQIRPIYPLYKRDDLLLAEDVTIKAKASTSTTLMFVEECSKTEGPCCLWSGGRKASLNQQICKKGNLARFSKLRRFGEFVLRSNSRLGKDAFIFFNHEHYSFKHSTTITTTACKKVVDQQKKKKWGQAKIER